MPSFVSLMHACIVIHDYGTTHISSSGSWSNEVHKYLVMWLKSRMPLRQMNSKVPCDFHSQWSLHSKRRTWSQNHPGCGWVCSFSEIPSTSSCWKFWYRKEWENGHSICLPVYHSSCSRPFWPNQEASLSSLSEENHNWIPITSRIDVTISLIYSKYVSDFQK